MPEKFFFIIKICIFAMFELKTVIKMNFVKSIAIVIVGCIVGVAVRFALSGIYAESYPFGTLSTNIIGAFIVGIAIGYIAKSAFSSDVKILSTTGFCIGFTVFSAFSRNAIEAVDIGNIIIAAIYITISVCIGIIAVCLGLQLKRR